MKEKHKKQTNKQTKKQRQKKNNKGGSYNDRVRAKCFCCAFSLDFL